MKLRRIGFSLIALACLPLLFSACKAQQTKIPNPIVEVDGPQAFVPILGMQLRAPEDAGDVSYTTIDGRIAQILFASGGKEYSYRAAKASDEDISGVYGEFSDDQARITVDGDGASADLLLRFLSDGSGALATWNIGDITFSLFSKDTADEAAVRPVATGLALLAIADLNANTPAV